MPEPRQEPCHYHDQKFDRPVEPRSRTLQFRSTYIMAEFIFGTGISIVQARTESVWISDQHLQNTRSRVRTFDVRRIPGAFGAECVRYSRSRANNSCRRPFFCITDIVAVSTTFSFRQFGSLLT